MGEDGSAKDLRLNSIARYQKQSPEFAMEMYGHCEVPAGCGGVVLRWRKFGLGIPIEMWTYTVGKATFILDGVEPPSSHQRLTTGEHVLCWTIEEFDPAAAILLFAGAFDPAGKGVLLTPPADGDGALIHTTPDGSWRYTDIAPADDEWLQPRYDDSAWLPMIARPVTPIEEKAYGAAYRLKRLQELGVGGLGVVGAIQKVWIRRRFALAVKL